MHFNKVSVVPSAVAIEDPLSYLPCSKIVEFEKKQTIYSANLPSAGLYLIIEGTVKVSSTTSSLREVVVDIYHHDEFFGESALLGPQQTESAVTLEPTKVMVWSATEIEQFATQRPKLGIALVQLLVKRSIDFGARIESFSMDTIVRRLARSLVRFADRLGTEAEDGSVSMASLTHELLAQYVGTSREIVTHFMNRFRDQGLLCYSRNEMTVQTQALQDWLGSKRLTRAILTDKAA